MFEINASCSTRQIGLVCCTNTDLGILRLQASRPNCIIPVASWMNGMKCKKATHLSYLPTTKQTCLQLNTHYYYCKPSIKLQNASLLPRQASRSHRIVSRGCGVVRSVVIHGLWCRRGRVDHCVARCRADLLGTCSVGRSGAAVAVRGSSVEGGLGIMFQSNLMCIYIRNHDL